MYLLLGSSSASDKLGTIIGGIIGVAFGILVLFIIFMILYCKWHRLMQQRSKTCALYINILYTTYIMHMRAYIRTYMHILV